jgi:hypothetical protein
MVLSASDKRIGKFAMRGFTKSLELGGTLIF